jgi:hypothetical protein
MHFHFPVNAQRIARSIAREIGENWKKEKKKRGEREKKKINRFRWNGMPRRFANATRGFPEGERNAEIDVEKFGESRSFLFRSREIECGRSRDGSCAPQPEVATSVAIQDARTCRLPPFRFPNSIIRERSSE